MTNHTIEASALPQIDIADFKKHPSRFLKKKLIAKLVIFLPLLVAGGVLFYFVDDVTTQQAWISLGVWFVLLLLTLFVAYKEYFVRGYVLREHDITYRHGWLFHHELTVPFNRIQHTEINQGPIDRLFNLCELEIFTAGGASSDLSISGLDPDDAARIKEFVSGNVATHA